MANGDFTAKGFPASLACPGRPGTAIVSGSGRWEFEPKMMRINLAFSKFDDSSCSPFLANVFVETSGGTSVVVLYPNGVDDSKSKIELMKR